MGVNNSQNRSNQHNYTNHSVRSLALQRVNGAKAVPDARPGVRKYRAAIAAIPATSYAIGRLKTPCLHFPDAREVKANNFLPLWRPCQPFGTHDRDFDKYPPRRV